MSSSSDSSSPLWQTCPLPGVPMPGEAPTPAGSDQQAFGSCWELSSRIAVCRDRILGRGVGSNSLRQQPPSLSVGCFLCVPTVYIPMQSGPVSRRRGETRRRHERDSRLTLGFDLVITQYQGRRRLLSRHTGQTHLCEVPLPFFFFFFTFSHRVSTEGSDQLDGCTLQARGRNKPSHAAASSQSGAGQPT